MSQRASRRFQWPLFVGLALVFVLTLLPFYLTLANSLKYRMQITMNIWIPTPPFHFDNYARAFREIWRGLFNSVFVTACIILGALLCSSLAAYSFARFSFPGKTFLYFSIIAFLMIPGFLTLIPQFMLFRDMKLLNTYPCIILPVIATTAVMPTIFFRTFFEGLPKSLLESAEIEGAGELRIFFQIVLPLSKSMIGTVVILTGLAGWNNYIWPLVTLTDRAIMPVILQLRYIPEGTLEGMGPRLAGYTIASVPLVVLFAIATKPFIRGVTSGAIKL